MKILNRTIIVLMVCLIFLSGFTFCNRTGYLQRRLSQTNNLSSMIYKVLPSVVFVKADGKEYGNWSGSGVIVGSHIILTAKHIIADANNLTITTIDGNNYRAIDWIVDPNNDCGLLFFEEKFITIAKFTDSSKLLLGDRIFTIGSPYGETLFNTVTTGIISGLGRKIEYFGDAFMITSDVEANPGNSGGPVFNMQGKLIGIVVGTYSYYKNGIIIIPGNICQRFLK